MFFNVDEDGKLNDQDILVEDESVEPIDLIKRDSDNNFLLLLDNGKIMLIDKNGNASEFANLPLAAEFNEGVRTIVNSDRDGGYIVCGGTKSGLSNQTTGTFVLEVDQNGVVSSPKRSFNSFSSSDISARPEEIYQTTDNSFIITGSTTNNNRTFYAILDCI